MEKHATIAGIKAGRWGAGDCIEQIHTHHDHHHEHAHDHVDSFVVKLGGVDGSKLASALERRLWQDTGDHSEMLQTLVLDWDDQIEKASQP